MSPMMPEGMVSPPLLVPEVIDDPFDDMILEVDVPKDTTATVPEAAQSIPIVTPEIVVIGSEIHVKTDQFDPINSTPSDTNASDTTIASPVATTSRKRKKNPKKISVKFKSPTKRRKPRVKSTTKTKRAGNESVQSPHQPVTKRTKRKTTVRKTPKKRSSPLDTPSKLSKPLKPSKRQKVALDNCVAPVKAWDQLQPQDDWPSLSWQEMLQQQVGKHWENIPIPPERELRREALAILGGCEWAQQVERYLFYRFFLVDRLCYARRFLTVAANAKINPHLRLQSARQVCTMSDPQLIGNTDLQQRPPIVAPQKRKERQGGIKCHKCERLKRNCFDTEWYTRQTRSADEPETVFVYCYQCNRKWVHS